MSRIRQYAIETIRSEASAVQHLEALLTDDFDGAVETILHGTGKVIVTGMGKSGHIGRKIAATLASTGTPAFFLHPGEAYHGDLGMISPGDIILAITHSGQTDEVLKLIPFLESHDNVLISMTGNPASTLAQHSRFHLNTAVQAEACPMNLAPTSSSTTALVMGDALAVALMKMRGFREEDFAIYHPGGTLGRRLLTRVSDVMRRELPLLGEHTPLGEVIIAISDARVGIAAIVDTAGRIKGVITDGDVRRAMTRYKEDFFNIPACEVMSRAPKTIGGQERLTQAEQMMREHKIHSIVVVDIDNQPIGVVEFFDIALTGETFRQAY